MKRLILFFSLLSSLLVCSCVPEEPTPPVNPTPQPGQGFKNGVFVINEGTYTYANASLSFYDPQKDTVMNNLFYRANGAPIGDVGQSLAMIDDQLFIVVNNSNHIYKVDATTLKCDTTKPYMLGDFYSPRYFLPLSPNKAYVSDLAGRNLWIIDPENLTHTGTIAMGKPTETMVMVGHEVYVTNWSNYYDNEVENNTVMVVDAQNDVKVGEIVVGKEPNGMVVDKDGNVWVLCEGAYWAVEEEDVELPTLWKIFPRTKKARRMLTIDGEAMCLAVDPQGTCLYCIIDGNIRRILLPEATLDERFCIPSQGRTFYKIAVNPSNGELYVTDARNYMVSGDVYRYTSDGLLLSSFHVGICPGYMLFN